MPLPEAFTIAVTMGDTRMYLQHEDDRFLSVSDVRSATKFSTRSGTEKLIELIEKHREPSDGSELTLCDQDGFAILDTIETPIRHLSASQSTKGGC
jgi:hypothetical protein